MTKAEKINIAIGAGQLLVALLIFLGFDRKSMPDVLTVRAGIVLLLIAGGWAFSLYALYLSSNRPTIPMAATPASQKWLYTPLKEIYRRKFHNERVLLDGFHYIDCEFGAGVTFVYDGLKQFNLTNPKPLPDFTWAFQTGNVSIQRLIQFLQQTGMIGGALIHNPPWTGH
jgi:hypothetical protein